MTLDEQQQNFYLAPTISGSIGIRHLDDSIDKEKMNKNTRNSP